MSRKDGEKSMGLFDWLFGKKPSQETAQADSSVFSPLVGENHIAILDRPPTLPESAYMVPMNLNEQEISRLDFQHFILRQVLRGNYVAPLQKPQTILEVGGGTGRWCYEMAQSFPQASVIRCNRVEAKSVSQKMPHNYNFVQADLSRGLPFPNQYFDFVHQRSLFFSIPTVAWLQLLHELVRVTAPGGWVELVEMLGPGSKPGPYVKQAIQWRDEASLRLGVDVKRLDTLNNDLRQAGFAHLKGYAIPVPIGSWGGHIGRMMASNIIAVQQIIQPVIVEQLGVSAAQFEQNSIMEQQEWDQVHGTVIFYVVYAQRNA